MESAPPLGNTLHRPASAERNSVVAAATQGATTLNPAAQQLFQLMISASAPGLLSIESRIRSTFKSDALKISEISDYLLSLGGKRIRPILALSTARMFGMTAPSQELIDAAAGIELIHMATLLHDDIIDESATRRHKPSAYKAFGLSPSLITGDFLLARAFGLCAHLDLFVIEATETACVELTEGEILEGKIDPLTPISMAEYLTIVEKKTAALFTLAGAVGSHIAGASEADVTLVTAFAREAGIAFQMVDDILDVTAEEDLLGKPSGTDIRQKTPSLINLLWLESGAPEAQAAFSERTLSAEEGRAVARSLRNSAVVERAKTLATERAEVAKSHLTKLSAQSDDQVRAQLSALVDYTLERCL